MPTQRFYDWIGVTYKEGLILNEYDDALNHFIDSLTDCLLTEHSTPVFCEHLWICANCRLPVDSAEDIQMTIDKLRRVME